MQKNSTSFQQEFRESMARLGSSVCIVTTKGDAGTCGITVSAVCSVTDTPATVMVCINKNSAMNEVFRANKKIAINILSAEQKEIALQFSGKTDLSMSDRFLSRDWQNDETPRLHSATASLLGSVTQTTDMGTHTIFFIAVETIHLANQPSALVYCNRKFHQINE